MTREYFFQQLILYFTEQIYNNSENKMKIAYITQNKNRDALLNQISKILLSYNIKDNIMDLSTTERTNLLNQISSLIKNNIQKEMQLEKELIKQALTEAGHEKHNTNNYILSLGSSFKPTFLNDDLLKNIINTKVDKKLWSDRLYDNKNAIYKILILEIDKFLKGETNVNEIESKIREKCDSNLYNTRRLLQDNICRVQEGVNDAWQQEHNIEYVMYMATLDSHVCDDCKRFDGKVYPIDKKPVSLPQHPFDRCTYVSLPDKDWRPKMRLNNETKEKVNWQTYEEWYKNKKDDIISNRKWLQADFVSEKKFNKHIEKHLKEYGDISEKEYLETARKLLAQPISDDVEGFVTKKNFVFKYRRSTNDFAVGRADGYISTLFRPEKEYEYWLEQIQEFKED